MPRWGNKNCGFQKNRKVTKETGDKISGSNKGRTVSAEIIGYVKNAIKEEADCILIIF